MRILRGVPESEVFGAGIVFGECRARLHRVRHQPVVDDIELGDMLGGGESSGGRFRVAQMPLVDRVVGNVGMDLRRACGLRLGRVDHGRQHFVIDLHLLGRVTALRNRLCDHHGNRIADTVDLAGCERRVRRHLHRRAVLGMDHPAANQVAYLVGGQIRADEHGNHARHFLRRAGIDAFDLGVGMRRAHEGGAGLARPHHVVGILSLARDEAEVFLSAHRRADPGRALSCAHWRPPPVEFF